jgi:hypothetical protein
MSSGPERKEDLSGPELVAILRDVLAEAKQIEVVVFAGGEPLLLGDTLLDGIRTACSFGKVTRVITNAYWATSAQEARRVVQMLRAAGLHELNVSTDDHHLPFISLQRVRWAYDAACEADFLSVAITHCGGPASILTAEMLQREFGAVRPLEPRYDATGMPHQQRWVPGQTKTVLSNAPLQRIGRGIDRIGDGELPVLTGNLATDGGCKWAMRSPSITPSGHLVACCGFELEGNPVLDYGDLRETPARELLDAVDQDLPTNLIAILGPPLIKDLLVRNWPNEVRFERDYRSVCEVCWDLVYTPENRAAFARHQGELVDTVLAVREQIRALWSNTDGEVVLPVDLVMFPSAEANRRVHEMFHPPGAMIEKAP